MTSVRVEPAGIATPNRTVVRPFSGADATICVRPSRRTDFTVAPGVA